MTSPKIALLAAALLAMTATAVAQQPAQTAPRPAAAPAQQTLTPAQQAALTKQNAEVTQAAQQIMQMVDGNRVGDAWDGASAVMKQVVPRDEFVKQVTIDRNRLGKPATRGAAAISRAQFPAGANVPQGLYINIATPTKFANSAQPVRELVSFRLDEDKTWRLSGYSLR